MLYFLLQIKRLLEELLMWPWVQAGKRRAKREPIPADFDLFCFFPSPSLGGAEKINAYVLDAFPEKKVMVVFTKKFKHESFIDYYRKENAAIADISERADNKNRYWLSFVERGKWSYYINSQSKKPSVFIGQCNFGYKLSSHLNKSVHVAELIHVAEKKFAWITFPFIPFLKVRITPGQSITNQHLKYYKEIGVPERYNGRWQTITYKLAMLPTEHQKRKYELPLKVYYAGRGGYQKRLWLLMQIINECSAKNLPIEFHLAGPIEDEIDEDIKKKIIYHGQIKTTEAMYALHQKMDVLIMTSAFEGFPLVIQEAMANGAVPLVTAVDVIPEHIVHGENGYLINNPEDENQVVQSAMNLLQEICQNPGQLNSIRKNAYQYAQTNFGANTFNSAYRKAIFPYD